MWRCSESDQFYYENGREIRIKGYKFRGADFREEKTELIDSKSSKNFYFIVRLLKNCVTFKLKIGEGQ